MVLVAESKQGERGNASGDEQASRSLAWATTARLLGTSLLQ